MRRAVERFEALLAGRDFFIGEFGLADVIAFPFLKYPVLGLAPDDHDPFHAESAPFPAASLTSCRTSSAPTARNARSTSTARKASTTRRSRATTAASASSSS